MLKPGSKAPKGRNCILRFNSLGYYSRLFYSYNIPEFCTSEFKLDRKDLTQEKKKIGQR